MTKKTFIITVMVLIMSVAQSVASSALEWKLLSAQDKSILDFISSVNPKFSRLIGSGDDVYSVVTDLDKDDLDDVILHFSNPDQCGVDGCLYVVIYSSTSTFVAYTAYSFQIAKNNLIVDGTKLELTHGNK
jgi:hypothetical protein